MTKIRDTEQIVEAAVRVFNEKGYEAASLDDIAAELGTARSALYYYVSGKADLWARVQIMRVTMLVDEVLDIATAETDAAAKLAGIVRAHVHHFERFFPESKSWSYVSTHTDVRDSSTASLYAKQKEFEQLLRAVLREGIEAGAFRRDLDAPVAALGIIGMCHYLTTWYRPDGRMTAAQIGDELAALATASVRESQPGPRGPTVR